MKEASKMTPRLQACFAGQGEMMTDNPRAECTRMEGLGGKGKEFRSVVVFSCVSYFGATI